MSRRKSREMALQTLFQLDFNGEDEIRGALEAVFNEREDVSENAKQYAEELVSGTKKHLVEIDQLIADISNEWKIDRMAGVDRNIARMAIYEMKFGSEKLPVGVAINEAVELAKLFGTEESGRFINGILGSLHKNKGK